MSNHRRDDSPTITYHHRNERVFEQAGKWYFRTREGVVEGPFENRVGASHRISAYIQMLETQPDDNSKNPPIEAE